MNFMDGYRSKVEDELRLQVQKGSTPLLDLNTMLTYHMGFTDRFGNDQDTTLGKYLRPLFCLAMCEGIGGNVDQALPAAASIELSHRTTLVLDDIQDKGRERNNQPTVWSIWGVNQAINAGFALFSYAHVSLLRLRQRHVPATVILEVWRVMEEAALQLSWGQTRDISFEDRVDLAVGDYLEMVRWKTGSLFAAACEVGAMISTVPHRRHPSAKSDSGDKWYRYIGDLPVADLARDFGMNIGIAFQIHDDYLGIWGEEQEVGKTANDLMERKKSLPVVLALEMAPGLPKTDRYTIEQFLKQETIRPEDAAIFKRWMEDNGIPAKVREYEIDYSNAAMEKLDGLRLASKQRVQFEQALSFLLKRKV